MPAEVRGASWKIPEPRMFRDRNFANTETLIQQVSLIDM